VSGEKAFIHLPDFITRARRELMLSAIFFVFFVGAISAARMYYPVMVTTQRSRLCMEIVEGKER
jgi:hypothetical protein